MGRDAAMMGTSAYDLDRLSALPEIGGIPYHGEREYEGEAERPREQARPRTRVRKRAARQSVTGFAVLGWAVVIVMLLLVVLSHMQLAVVSHEMARLDRQANLLQEEAQQLRVAHEMAFHPETVELFARYELGMVDATRGQVVVIGSTTTDVSEILHVTPTEETGLFTHLVGLLREYLPFLSS